MSDIWKMPGIRRNCEHIKLRTIASDDEPSGKVVVECVNCGAVAGPFRNAKVAAVWARLAGRRVLFSEKIETLAPAHRHYAETLRETAR